MAYLEDSIRNNPHLSSTTKLFLLTLATYADKEGVCWPSEPTIATAMSMSVATVQRELKKALELGLVEVRRRWRKSNVYRLLCVKKPELSTMTSPDEVREQLPSVQENVRNACGKRLCESKNPWRIAKVILSDICEAMPHLVEKNLGWFKVISQKCSYEAVQQVLHELRCRLLEAEVGSTEPIRSPSGWFTYRLRELGNPI